MPLMAIRLIQLSGESGPLRHSLAQSITGHAIVIPRPHHLWPCDPAARWRALRYDFTATKSGDRL